MRTFDPRPPHKAERLRAREAERLRGVRLVRIFSVFSRAHYTIAPLTPCSLVYPSIPQYLALRAPSSDFNSRHYTNTLTCRTHLKYVSLSPFFFFPRFWSVVVSGQGWSRARSRLPARLAARGVATFLPSCKSPPRAPRPRLGQYQPASLHRRVRRRPAHTSHHRCAPQGAGQS